MHKIPVHIGLRVSGKEPPAESGYSRIPLGDMNILDVPTLLKDRQIVFNDVTAPGYGLVTDICAFDQDGELLYIWPLPEPVDVHEGVVPGIVDGRLIRGLDVSAQVIASLKDACEVKKERADRLKKVPEKITELFNSDRTRSIRNLLERGAELHLRAMHSYGCWTVGVPLRAEDFEKVPEDGSFVLRREIVVDELPPGVDVLGMGIFRGVTLLRCFAYEDLEHLRNTNGCRIVFHPRQLRI